MNSVGQSFHFMWSHILSKSILLLFVKKSKIVVFSLKDRMEIFTMLKEVEMGQTLAISSMLVNRGNNPIQLLCMHLIK